MSTTTRSSQQTSLRWMHRILTMVLILSIFTTIMPADASPAQQDSQPSFPIRAAFYYPWYPEGWNRQGFKPFTNYHPSLGFYDASQKVTKKHIAAMQYGGIQAGIALWAGQGSKTDGRIPGLLKAAAGTNFRWSIYYEPENQGNPSVAQLKRDLTYIRNQYGNNPSFLRVNGRFVVFVHGGGKDGCNIANRWKRANTVGAYIVLQVFPGYRKCPNQPDSWHQYSPTVAANQQRGYSYTISPGFWQKGKSVRLERDLNRWHQSIRDMVASREPWQLITTFNEWGQGSSVESAKEWKTGSGYGAYLDALHKNGNGSPAQPTATNVQPTRTNPPAATNIPPTQTRQPTATFVSPTQTLPSNPTAIPATQTSRATAVVPSNTAALPSATATRNPAVSPTPTSRPTFTASPIPSPTRTATQSTSGDPVIGAAGDIACDPTSGSFNGGNGTASSCHQKAVSDVMLSSRLTAVLTLGDAQYDDGTLAQFQQSYDLSWGHLKNITHPAVGNHEYGTAGASGYFSYFGAAAGDRTKGYYSYNLGAWHIIALNSNCSQVGGCGVGSPQEQWLKADLAAHPNMCTLAYWHHPRFSSGRHGNNTASDAFWRALYAAGVELVLVGHDHNYERFAPQTPNGQADPRGIQQFVVGTGGKNHALIPAIQPNSVVRNGDSFGFLELTLHPTSYDWQFVPEPGKTFTDSGSRNCFTASSASSNSAALTNVDLPSATVSGAGPTVPPAPADGGLTFAPVADAYVTAAIPNTNYGSSQMIRFDSNPVVNGYLTFNVQGVNAPIASAQLKIYANSSTSVGCKVFAVPDVGWNEQTITYNTAPPLGDQIGEIGAFRGGSWITINVTSLVTGNGTFSLALSSLDADAVSFASRESGNFAPQLIVTTR